MTPTRPFVPVAWSSSPRQVLPRRVVAFRHEVVHSFIARLASANYLNLDDFTAYLAGRRYGPPQLDRLAKVAGYDTESLRTILAATGDTDRFRRRQMAEARPACRRCMARRGTLEAVRCWFPDHHTVCQRHHLWIGPSVTEPHEQQDITGMPDVVAASRRHRRIVRRYGVNAAQVAYRDATNIVDRWHHLGQHLANHRHRLAKHLDAHGRTRFHEHGIESHAAAYPDIITVTTVLINPRWREYAAQPPTGRLSAGTLVHLRKQEIYNQVSQHLGLDCRPASYDDPLARWVRDQERTRTPGHLNAARPPAERRRLCERIDAGEAIKHVAIDAGISRRTLSNWHTRWRQDSERALIEKSSAPHNRPTETTAATTELIIQTRKQHNWGPAKIANHLADAHSISVAPATIHRILTRHELNRR